MQYKTVVCPIRYGEVEYTKEFNDLIADGWKVHSAGFNESNWTVKFRLAKED